MQMSIKQAPRVAFSLNIVPKWRARLDLARMMTRQLSKSLGCIQLHPGFILGTSVLVVSVNGEKFLIGICKVKYPGSAIKEWQIEVSPARFSVPRKHFPEDAQEKYAKELMNISNKIQAVLARTPGVTRLRWFFVGWGFKTPGVHTPLELPWRVDVQVHGGAENQKMS